MSQTEQLLDQVINISWTGGAPTQPAFGSFATNYMQIMQCWGDDPSGPQREQCQFGGLFGDTRGGLFVTSRQVSYGSALVDPAETYKQLPGSLNNVYVPFRSVTGVTDDGTQSQFFDSYSTNEIPFGRTHADGTGQEFFEVETAREAPGLGCGEVVKAKNNATSVRACWLVIVPRGDTEVNGAPLGPGASLNSSPLSASNWANRIVVPLHFAPLAIACPIGSAERRTVGREVISEAMTSWQSGLCSSTHTIYGFSQVADDLARQQLTGTDPELAFVGSPLNKDAQVSAPVVYAPVALSGLTIGFDIERKSQSSASADEKAHDGDRITQLNLTPRLVAKLLTQSYRFGAFYGANYLSGNPVDMTRDPDFLALNPTFKGQLFTGIADVLVPLGTSDAAAQLWGWIRSDAAAKAFLAGKPDPWGMTVNPAYKNVDPATKDFPKSDTYCETFSDGRRPLCTLDAHPYANDMHDAARSASRGDSLSRAVWDPTATPPQWKKSPPELSGSRALLAFADTATAARYQLAMAKLQNAGGAFVAPSPASMDAAVEDPASKTAYPLTTVTYAATVPNELTVQQREDYAALIRYAIGPGQRSGVARGELPPGYAPLPAKLRTEATTAAQQIETPHSPTPPSSAVPTARAAHVDAQRLEPSTASSTPMTGRQVRVNAPAKTPSLAAQAHRATPQPSIGLAANSPVITPATPVGAARFDLAAVLLIGALAAGAGSALLRPTSGGRGWRLSR